MYPLQPHTGSILTFCAYIAAAKGGKLGRFSNVKVI